MMKYEAPPSAPSDVEDQLGWLALSLTPGLGPRRILGVMKELEVDLRAFAHRVGSIAALSRSSSVFIRRQRS